VPGAPEPHYVLARRTLLDALEALGDQRAAVIVIGAQAIYLLTGEADIAVAPFTTDGDLGLVPELLQDEPQLARALETAGFMPTREIGIWVKHGWLAGDEVLVTIDLLVPETLGGPGRRAARLGAHGDRIARKVSGLEGIVVDRVTATIGSLETGDRRAFQVAVAGPAALMVAKLHKIRDRTGTGRSSDKDALDLLRLLRAVPSADLVARFTALLAASASADVTRRALAFLDELFGLPAAVGSRMAARAVETLEDPETIAASCAALTRDLLRLLEAASLGH
jgi:hypothetical protein